MKVAPISAKELKAIGGELIDKDEFRNALYRKLGEEIQTFPRDINGDFEYRTSKTKKLLPAYQKVADFLNSHSEYYKKNLEAFLRLEFKPFKDEYQLDKYPAFLKEDAHISLEETMFLSYLGRGDATNGAAYAIHAFNSYYIMKRLMEEKRPYGYRDVTLNSKIWQNGKLVPTEGEVESQLRGSFLNTAQYSVDNYKRYIAK